VKGLPPVEPSRSSGGTRWTRQLRRKGLPPACPRSIEAARSCLHPDAQWFVSLLPAEIPATREGMRELMLQHRQDPRASFLAWVFADWDSRDELAYAAGRGYAPAQARMCANSSDAGEGYEYAQKAAAQGDRWGLCELAYFFEEGECCAKDTAKAIDLYREAAELGHSEAMHYYGELAFAPHEWERWHWWGRAAERGYLFDTFPQIVTDVWMPVFEGGRNGRVLHTIAAVLRRNLNVTEPTVFGRSLSAAGWESIMQVLALHDGMLNRARAAIDCWSMAARRLRVVKDMRVVIAKMVWEEPWRWSNEEKTEQKESKKAKRRRK
jgi:hypothetical protein